MNRTPLAEFQQDRLRLMLNEVLPPNPFYNQRFEAAGVNSRSAFHSLPFTTKQELLDDQAQHPPCGTNLTYPLNHYCRLHQTSGTKGQPLRWLDTPDSWQWFMDCWRQIYEIIGLRRDDRLFFPFSFGPFIGFWAAFEGAARLGNMCLAGGGMTTSARLRFMIDNQATVVCCTPTYALRLAEAAKEENVDLAGSPVRALIVAGEPGGSIPATRERIETAWGARVFDHTGMTEIGSLGIECVENAGGVHLLETECIAEVIDFSKPDYPHVAPDGEGELVLTNLGRWGSPLIRYRTGDRVVVDSNPCSCGRPFVRLIGGIRGRADDMIFIRGNNVYPSSLEAILRRFPEVDEYRIEVEETGALAELSILLEGDSIRAPLAGKVEEAIRDQLHFRPAVRLVAPGTLPRSEMKSQRVVRKIK